MSELYKIPEVTNPVELLPKIAMGPMATKHMLQGEKGTGNSAEHFAGGRER